MEKPATQRNAEKPATKEELEKLAKVNAIIERAHKPFGGRLDKH